MDRIAVISCAPHVCFPCGIPQGTADGWTRGRGNVYHDRLLLSP